MAKAKQSTEEAITETRERIAQIKQELADLRGRPVTRDEALAALDRWIEARQGEFNMDNRVAGLLRGEASTQVHFTGIAGGGPDYTPALCALVPDQIREHYAARIDQALADRDPISSEDHEQRRLELEQDLLAAEWEEEALIEQLEVSGPTIPRREDADPRAILGLEEPPAPPPAPERETPEPTQHKEHGRTVIHHGLARENREREEDGGGGPVIQSGAGGKG